MCLASSYQRLSECMKYSVRTYSTRRGELRRLDSLLFLRWLTLCDQEFRRVTTVNKDDAELRRAIDNELRVLRGRGLRVPDKIEDRLFRRLSSYESTASTRATLYCEAFEREEARAVWIQKELERNWDRREFMKKRRLRYADHASDPESFHPSSSILPSWLDRDLTVSWPRHNSLFALTFGQPIVIDLGLPYEMDGQETRSLYHQLKDMYLTNAIQREPFSIHLCNFNADDSSMSGILSKCSDFLWSVSRDCFSTTFPSERLVYLTPDSPHVIGGAFRHDDVFVLGACVDIRRPTRLSYETVKRLGIRSARLDVDAYFYLTSKRKKRSRNPDSLFALSDVFNVILDARDSVGDWELAHRNLITGRKKVLEWKPEKEHLKKRISDFRFQRILENVALRD